MSHSFTSLVDTIRQHAATQARTFVAIAGPPTAGKSTLAHKLQNEFGQDCVLLPMDGFHLHNGILDTKNIRHRKGSPQSFDVYGFVNLIQRVAANETVYAPTFNRELDVALANVVEVTTQKIILVEGNYLYLNQSPWNKLLSYWHIKIWLPLSLATVEKRSIQRWTELGKNPNDFIRHIAINDIPNAQIVLKNSNLNGILQIHDSTFL